MKATIRALFGCASASRYAAVFGTAVFLLAFVGVVRQEMQPATFAAAPQSPVLGRVSHDDATSTTKDETQRKEACARWIWEHHVLEYGLHHDNASYGALAEHPRRENYPWGEVDEKGIGEILGQVRAAGLCDKNIRDEDLEYLSLLPNLWHLVLDTDTTGLSGKGLRRLTPRKDMLLVTIRGGREVPKDWIENLVATDAFGQWRLLAPVTDDAMLALAGQASRVREVTLWQPGGLTEKGYDPIGRLNELERLEISCVKGEPNSGNQVGEEELYDIARCTRLKWLRLSPGRFVLSTPGAKALAGMPELTYLSIDCSHAPSQEALAAFERLERATVHIAWPSDRSGFRKEGTAASSSQLTESKSAAEDGVIVNSIGMRLKRIPKGEFAMGSADDESRRDEDEQQHRVRITKPFYMAVHEVTQQQYQQIMGANPSYFSGAPNHLSLPPDASQQLAGKDTGRFPVERVSWNEAMEFCRRLGEKEENRYSLPTEAQWEYACRAGTTTAFAFGDNASSGLDANFSWDSTYGGVDRDKYLGRTAMVGSYRPNAWGLYDMHGNVSEWCRDWYSPDYYADSAADDPAGPAAGLNRVVRGGAYFAAPRLCRSANRGMFNPQRHDNYVGLRVVLIPREK